MQPTELDRISFLQRHLLHLTYVRANLRAVARLADEDLPINLAWDGGGVAGNVTYTNLSHQPLCNVLRRERSKLVPAEVNKALVGSGLDLPQSIANELERRADVHDASKLFPDEFEGFARISGAAARFAYGSQGYKDSIASEMGPNGAVRLHYSRNSHHPEYHDDDPLVGMSKMGFFDVIEMVCDWRAAHDTYDAFRPAETRISWLESIDHLTNKYKPIGWQQWLIDQLVAFFNPAAL